MNPLRAVVVIIRSLFLPGLSLIFLPLTVLSLLLRLKLRTLFSLSAFQDAWVSRFWSFFGPISLSSDTPTLKPILTAHVSGTVVHLGPATGLTVPLLPAAQITRYIALEPNTFMHPGLQIAVAKTGIKDYEVSAKGVEEEELNTVVPDGLVDTVISLKALCRVSQPQQVLRALYKSLKPGGKMVMFEHVKNRNVWWVGTWQNCLQVVWPFLLGGCNITRDTGKWIEEAGEWEDVQWLEVTGQQKWEPMPFVLGVLRKAGGPRIVEQDPDIIRDMQIQTRGLWPEDMRFIMVVYVAASYCFWGLLEAAFG